ncbi:flagellar basal body-associated FliL family protein [Hylemonella sp. W303a]|uniref:flagellar basal body-associated FliL family protein n=1 Tax=Hylemonella sp. W303a TaxID=3389873 RepID=UPI00396B3A83
MATANKPAETAAAPAEKPKSKRLLMIGVALVLLAVALAGGWLYLQKRNADIMLGVEEEHQEEEEEVVVESAAPIYLPLDTMVVNLSPDGDRVAQIGITLEVSDAQALEKVKSYLPALRSDILLLLSQRSAEELLTNEGKEKLKADILASAAAQMKAARKKGEKRGPQAVRKVHFSSFIVQ